MRHDLSQEQIRRFRADGFLVYDDLLDAGELEELRAAVDRGVERYGSFRSLENRAWKDDEAGIDTQVFRQRFDLWRVEPVVRRFMQGPELGSLAGRLAGVDALRVYYDQSLEKPPWGQATAFHFDNPYWSYHHRDAIVVWVALDDATEKNGCLQYLRGSHVLAEHRNAGFVYGIGGLFREHPELAAVEPVSATMRAGSCVFHNGRCAHGAGANLTPRWRRAMTTMYIPDGVVFNGQQDLLPDEHVRTLKVGDPIGDRHPLVWREEQPAGVR